MTPANPGKESDAAIAASIEEVISDLSRLRARIDSLDLPSTDAKSDLSTHLTLASMAALRLRFSQGEDDLIIE